MEVNSRAELPRAAGGRNYRGRIQGEKDHNKGGGTGRGGGGCGGANSRKVNRGTRPSPEPAARRHCAPGAEQRGAPRTAVSSGPPRPPPRPARRVLQAPRLCNFSSSPPPLFFFFCLLLQTSPTPPPPPRNPSSPPRRCPPTPPVTT